MAHIFISYKSVRRAAAEHLAESLIDSETLNVLVPSAPLLFDGMRQEMPCL